MVNPLLYFNEFILRLIATLIFIILNALILWITALLFDLEDKDFQTSLLIAIVTGLFLLVFSSIPFIGWLSSVLVHVVLITMFKRMYKYGWKKTIIIWLIWLALFIALSIIVATLFLFL